MASIVDICEQTPEDRKRDRNLMAAIMGAAKWAALSNSTELNPVSSVIGTRERLLDWKIGQVSDQPSATSTAQVV